MTTTETLKLALEALETCDAGDYSTGHVIYPSYDEEAVTKAITALREALAEQPAQRKCENCGEFGECCQAQPSGSVEQEPVGFAVMERPWVGLTDEEIDQGLLRSDYAFKTAEAWRAGVVFAMTKLKAKNSL